MDAGKDASLGARLAAATLAGQRVHDAFDQAAEQELLGVCQLPQGALKARSRLQFEIFPSAGGQLKDGVFFRRADDFHQTPLSERRQVAADRQGI
jgi:hypothetical protein